ncbi:hypothetical protein TWF730_006778 [Orbilia blumenaviensis]|uniref:UBC core domain-containing protein n=1 Tax=Orbilia blumenaviensis TaxID=1796055 RepID=A0AAV9VF91_9PEZI
MASANPVKYNKSSPGVRRILKEAQEIATSPSRDFTASPLEHNLFEWHFTIRGPPEPSPFAGGFYHGRILLSPNYPMRPPMFRFLTPSGRFEVNKDICLSISGYHEETWQPSWSIRLALIALRAHMDTDPQGQIGGLSCPPEIKRDMAKKSKEWKCSECGGGGEEEAMDVPEDSGTTEPEVPPELRFGYKEDMVAKKEGEDGKDVEKAEDASAPATAPAPATTPATTQSEPQQQQQSPQQVVERRQPAQQQQQQQEDQQEPAMFIPFGPGHPQQQQPQQVLAGGGAPGNIAAPQVVAAPGAVPMQIVNRTNDADHTAGYIDLAISILVAILIALVVKKM